MNKIIDVSHWQGTIDWKKVKKFGVKCAILKATQGLKMVDATFKTNRLKAREQGILVGAYHFADGNDAINEAENFLKTVGELLEGEFLVLDYEIHLKNPDQWCSIFLDYVKLKTGIKPLIYINSSTAKSFSWERVIKGGYGLWIASYGLNNGEMGKEPAIGKFPFYALWQYTSRSYVDGITGYVDMSYTKMDLKTLKKYGKIDPPAPAKPKDTSKPTEEFKPEVADPYPIAEAGIPYESEKTTLEWIIYYFKLIINDIIKWKK